MEPISALVRVACDMTRNHVELDCADLTIKAASIGHTRGDLVFRCTVNPVPNDLLGTLEDAARSYGTIRLVFPKQPLLLERVQVKRAESDSVEIVGRVVESSASA
jgi:hypothetical protein